MNNLYKKNNYCRLCKSIKIKKIVSIGESPVSEKYSSKKTLPNKNDQVPLDLYLCHECYHVQLIDIVNPDYLWSDFTFKTSRNKKIDNHYENYIENLYKRAVKTNIKFVLDIGSNDGTLLNLFKTKQKVQNILGIDPASNVVKEANKNGIPTIEGYMNIKNAENILLNNGKANVITANNVYAHVDDMDEITNAIKRVLDKDGIFVFEVSYLLDVLNKKLLGTIFHEHLSYYSLGPLVGFFKRHNLEIFHADRNDLQGGSIVCYVQHLGGQYQITNELNSLLRMERESKLYEVSTYEKFSNELIEMKKKINEMIDKIITEGKKIIGFGSARSATTLIKYFGIADKLEFIVDDNKEKHGLYTPGYPIKVLPTDNLKQLKKDYVIIFAWEHSKKIINNHKNFLENGGKFINIFPKIQIIDK